MLLHCFRYRTKNTNIVRILVPCCPTQPLGKYSHVKLGINGFFIWSAYRGVFRTVSNIRDGNILRIFNGIQILVESSYVQVNACIFPFSRFLYCRIYRREKKSHLAMYFSQLIVKTEALRKALRGFKGKAVGGEVVQRLVCFVLCSIIH